MFLPFHKNINSQYFILFLSSALKVRIQPFPQNKMKPDPEKQAFPLILFTSLTICIENKLQDNCRHQTINVISS